tara:strand:- start:1060 stop:2175 length:1116 start_codon:yes stop_codon:yes gene_type:complete
MATIFKNFLNNDVATTRTLLHEAVPVTGTIPSGTYTAEANIKNYAHGMFQSVYDYPYLSSSANHIFDLTVGFSADSPLSKSAPNTEAQQSKKINIYNQMAQMLVGYDDTGSIRKFDKEGSFSDTNEKMEEVFFINFARLLNKDEIKKGSFSLSLMTGATIPLRNFTVGGATAFNDTGSLSEYRTNSPAGEYGFIYSTTGSAVGLLYYQAGIAVITGSVFGGDPANLGGTANVGLFGPPGSGSYSTSATAEVNMNSASFSSYMTGAAGSISGACDGIRNSIKSVSFNNTTELNSTIYFCRAAHNEYNYSSNPTYLNASKLVVKNASTDMPVSYITSVGLYSADNELLATAKLSEPLKKTPTNELTLRVRLDY